MQPEGTPLYRLDFNLRWGEMDALGHVNNMVYFRYFEQTRIDWFESLGFGPIGHTGGEHGMVIVNNHAEYIKPVVYPAAMTVYMGGHSPGRSSFISTYTLGIGETLYTRGSAKIVWLDGRSGKSAALPEKVRQLIETGVLPK